MALGLRALTNPGFAQNFPDYPEGVTGQAYTLGGKPHFGGWHMFSPERNPLRCARIFEQGGRAYNPPEIF